MNETTVSGPHKKDILALVALVLFLAISAWFFYLHLYPDSFSDIDQRLKVWASAYQIIALFGGISGLAIAHKWGGFKSVIGRSVIFFSIGLLLQVLGQSVNSYYNIFHNQEIPYPSFGDVGFMGSVFAYIAGAYSLMKASGLKFSVRSVKGKFFGIAVPILILAGSYLFFLRGYEFDWTNTPKVILDFAYPFGQALYVSLAVLALMLSQNFLGGIMKKPIMSLIFALVFQYCSDFMFLYQANAGTWSAGGLNDYVYFMSYFLMTLALISMGRTFYLIRRTGTIATQ